MLRQRTAATEELRAELVTLRAVQSAQAAERDRAADDRADLVARCAEHRAAHTSCESRCGELRHALVKAQETTAALQQERQALELQLQLSARRLQHQERCALRDAAKARGVEVARASAAAALCAAVAAEPLASPIASPAASPAASRSRTSNVPRTFLESSPTSDAPSLSLGWTHGGHADVPRSAPVHTDAPCRTASPSEPGAAVAASRGAAAETRAAGAAVWSWTRTLAASTRFVTPRVVRVRSRRKLTAPHPRLLVLFCSPSLTRSFDFLIQLPLPPRRGRGRGGSAAAVPFAFRVEWALTRDGGGDVAVGFATAARGSPAVASALSASMPYVPAPPHASAPSPARGSGARNPESQYLAKAGYSAIDWRGLDVARPMRPADRAAESGAKRGGTLTLSPATRLVVVRFRSLQRARWFSWGVPGQKIGLRLSVEPVY